MGYIYLIVNPKGKLYVGQTYNLSHRIASHKCASKNGGSAVILHNSINKYGWEAHKLEIIETVDDANLDEREMYWIETLDTYVYKNKMGMNMTVGGGGNRGSWMHDIERRKKASIRFSGSNGPFYGKTHTDENKRIIGEKASKRNKEQGIRVPEWGAKKSIEKTSVPILLYNSKGEFQSEFKSLSYAAKELNVERKLITAVLVKRQIHTGGLFFKYKKHENYPLKIDVSGLVLKRMNSPIVLINSDKEVMRVYSSAKEASQELNTPQSNISRRAATYNGVNRKSGYTFVYLDEYQLSNQLN